jgi:hypothetical protein
MPLVMIKSILATVVLALAIGQAISGARLRGYLKRLSLPAGSLRTWHRLGGDAALLLTVTIAIVCVTQSTFSAYSVRVPLHAGLGTLAAVVMFAKVIIARRFRRYLRYSLILGTVAALSVLGCFAASALWYFRFLV